MSAIQSQIEFYFSDSNFRKDTFLKTVAANNVDKSIPDVTPEMGWVPAATLLTFNKMKSLATSEVEVIEAAKAVSAVVVDEEGKRIRRAAPLPTEDLTQAKTIYAKGFPVDDANVTIESISALFSQFGKVNLVRLRRDHLTRAFKGSAFVEFDSLDAKDSALKASHSATNEVTLTYNDVPLLCVMALTEWLERKKAKFDKKKGDKPVVKSEPGVGEKRKEEQCNDLKYDSGLIVKIGNLPSEVTLFQIKSCLLEFCDVKYVDFTPNAVEATIRLATVDGAAKLIEKLTGSFKLPNTENVLTVAKVEGEEESQYWNKIQAESKKKMNQNGGKKNKRFRK